MIEQKYITHLERCFEKAERLESKITDEVNAIEGMTGLMTRHFYNNLLDMDDARYLEIGVWQGSSTCAAMCGNKAYVVAMDDFSGFGSPREIFLKNFEKFKGDNRAGFVEADCFDNNLTVLGQFNIYLFDGDHAEESQFKGLNNFLPMMDDVFIFIADDANWNTVREGTNRAIKGNNLEVVWKKEILLDDTNKFTQNQELAKNTWWNGIIVYVLKKSK